MKPVIGPSLANIMRNTPDDVRIPVHVYLHQPLDFEAIVSDLETDGEASPVVQTDEGYIGLSVTGPQIHRLAEHPAVQRIEYDVFATDEPVEEAPPGGKAATRFREFFESRYPEDMPDSPLPNEPPNGEFSEGGPDPDAGIGMH